MPAPLSDSISDQLKSPATALAALLVIANHHRDALLCLRDDDKAESVEGEWRFVESEAPRACWVEPVSAVGRREHASA
jgi:hypothetical protein